MSVEQLLERLAAGGGERRYVYWDRGGPPGRGYEANHLTLRAVDGGSELVFMKTRYDEEQPPYKTHHYALALADERPVDLRALAAQTFARSFDEEIKPRIGGVTKLTLAFHAGGAAAEKTFYQHLPPELAPAQRQAEQLMARCEREGTLTRVSRPRR